MYMYIYKRYKKEYIFILFVKGFEFLIFTPLNLNLLKYTQSYLFLSSWRNWFVAVFTYNFANLEY